MTVWSQICDLIAWWARRDQIRVAPTEGRLLGLRIGDRFVLRDEVYVVVNCSVVEHGFRPQVRYDLNGSRGHCRLTVDTSQTHQVATGELCENSNRWAVFDDDLAMLK